MAHLLYKGLRYVRVHRRLPGWENLRGRHRPRMPLPRRLQIEPTTLCNLACTACTNRELPPSRRGKSMSYDFFRHIVDQVPSVREIKLQGLGEPLMAPEMQEMLEWGRSRGIKFDVITNGTLVRRHLTDIIPLLDRFVVSFDALSAPGATRMRSGLDVDVAKEAIVAMVEEKRRSHSACTIGLTCVLSHLNMDEVPGIMQFGNAAGVDYVGFVAVENWKIPGEDGFEDSRDFVEHAHAVIDMNRIRRIYETGSYAFVLGLQDTSPRQGECYWGFSSAYVTCDGFVTPCCLRPNPDAISFGNLQQQPFKVIWNCAEFQQFRRNHIENLPNRVCSRCPK